MFWRHVPTILFAIALILFGLSGYMYYIETDEPGAVMESQREFADLSVGSHVVKIELKNPTRHKVRVVGCGTC
jgi:hypothetical protein